MRVRLTRLIKRNTSYLSLRNAVSYVMLGEVVDLDTGYWGSITEVTLEELGEVFSMTDHSEFGAHEDMKCRQMRGNASWRSKKDAESLELNRWASSKRRSWPFWKKPY